MKCPKCGSRTYVVKTMMKKDFTIRIRKCTKRSCGYKFETIEQLSTGWDYKNIIKNIKEMIKDVK